MTTTTLNPSDESANVTLSNGNLTATFGSASDGAVRSTTSKTSGKWYVEFTPGGTFSGADDGLGIALAAASLTTIGTTAANAAVVFAGANPSVWFNGAFTGTNLSPTGLGTLVGMALDLDNKKLWLINYSTGNAWNGNNTTNIPSTNTGGVDISALFPGAGAFVAVSADQSGASATVNFGATSFVHAAPSGFSAWDVPVGKMSVVYNVGMNVLLDQS